jgi:hypothetical protein
MRHSVADKNDLITRQIEPKFDILYFDLVKSTSQKYLKRKKQTYFLKWRLQFLFIVILIPKDDGSHLQKDQAHGRIIKKLEPFMAALSLEDRALMTNMVTECYLKYQKAIQSKSEGDYLMVSLLMALLTQQNKRIKELG